MAWLMLSLKSKEQKKEDAMRTIATILGIIAPATVHAAEHATETTAGPMAWIFAGFCALVVVTQAVPAVMLLAGMIKGLVAKGENAEAGN